MLYGSESGYKFALQMQVLILIFLENALRHMNKETHYQTLSKVLILIFLENALRHRSKQTVPQSVTQVLILIFLENALRR